MTKYTAQKLVQHLDDKNLLTDRRRVVDYISQKAGQNKIAPSIIAAALIGANPVAFLLMIFWVEIFDLNAHIPFILVGGGLIWASVVLARKVEEFGWKLQIFSLLLSFVWLMMGTYLFVVGCLNLRRFEIFSETGLLGGSIWNAPQNSLLIGLIIFGLSFALRRIYPLKFVIGAAFITAFIAFWIFTIFGVASLHFSSLGYKDFDSLGYQALIVFYGLFLLYFLGSCYGLLSTRPAPHNLPLFYAVVIACSLGTVLIAEGNTIWREMIWAVNVESTWYIFLFLVDIPINLIMAAGIFLLMAKIAKDPWLYNQEPASKSLCYIGSFIIVILAALGTPGILWSILLLLAGRVRREYWLTGLGWALLPIILFLYYYRLDVSLLVKSGILCASGLTLLLFLAWIRIIYRDRLS